MSGHITSSRIDKGQTRFQPKLKARVPRRPNAGNEVGGGGTGTGSQQSDNTPSGTPTPSIGSDRDQTSSFGAELTHTSEMPFSQASTLIGTQQQPQSSQSQSSSQSIQHRNSISKSGGPMSPPLNPVNNSQQQRRTSTTATTNNHNKPGSPTFTPRSPVFSPRSPSFGPKRTSISINQIMNSTPSTPHPSDLFNTSSSVTSTPGTRITTGVASILATPTAAEKGKGKAIIAPGATRRTGDDTAADDRSGVGSSSSSTGKRTSISSRGGTGSANGNKRTKTGGRGGGAGRGKRPSVANGTGGPEELGQGEGGAMMVEEEEGYVEDETPDYSDTPMYMFVKDMGVGRRSKAFLERQQLYQDKRDKARKDAITDLINERRAQSIVSQEGEEGDNGQGSSNGGTKREIPGELNRQASEPPKKRMPTPPPANSAYAPQVRIINGKITLDVESLTVDHGAIEVDNSTLPMEYVDESASTRFINSASFMKRDTSDRWTAEENELFYQALSQWGTDFGIIHKIFHNKTRVAVRNKFRREDRTNHARVCQALEEKKPIDMIEYEEMAKVKFPEIEELEEMISKVEENDLALAKLEDENAKREEMELNGDEYHDDDPGVAEVQGDDEGGEEIVGMVGDDE